MEAFRNFQNSWIFWIPGIHGSLNSWFAMNSWIPGFLSYRILEFLVSWIPGFPNSWFPEFLVSRIPGFLKSWFPEFLVSRMFLSFLVSWVPLDSWVCVHGFGFLGLDYSVLGFDFHCVTMMFNVSLCCWLISMGVHVLASIIYLDFQWFHQHLFDLRWCSRFIWLVFISFH